MNTFGWLVLAHFLADWLLQSDWMAIGKRRNFFSWPGLIHYGVYTVIILIALHYSSEPRPPVLITTRLESTLTIMLVASIVFISHWIIDGTNLIHGWMRLFRQRQQLMVYIVIDQTLHLLVLGIVAAFLAQSCIADTNRDNAMCIAKSYVAQIVQWVGVENSTVSYPLLDSE